MTRQWHPMRVVNDIPLNRKFFLIYLLCVLIPIISINALFYTRVSDNIKARDLQNDENSMNRVYKDLNAVIEEGVALSHTISIDRSYIEALDRSYRDPVEFYDTYDNFLKDKLTPYISVYSHIDWISVYTTNATFDMGGNYYALSSEIKKADWYKRAMASSDKVALVTSYEPDHVLPFQQVRHISIIRKMNEYPDLTNVEKMLKIDMNMDNLADIFRREENFLNLELVDDRNRVIYATGAGFADAVTPKRYDPGALNGNLFFQERTLGTAVYMQGWKLVGYADSGKVDQALKHSRSFMILLAVVSTFVPTALIAIILRSYNYRVRKLSRHMEKVKNGKFDLISMPEGKDEIGGLIRSFNLMTAKIHSLIHDVYKLEIQKKDLELERVRAEMNILHSQLNPHFLFNTLNAVLVVCKKNQYGAVIGILKDLSLLLRRLLYQRDDLIPLSEELQFTEMYLNIEKFRFGDRFDYRCLADERALRCLVPKMSIQPLVENACKHGLQTVKGARLTEVRAETDERFLRIAVIDNGKGMEQGQLARILENIQSEQPMKDNIGIRNVFRRLSLYYGDTVQYAIESEAGRGTVVWMKIPLTSLPLEAPERKEAASDV